MNSSWYFVFSPNNPLTLAKPYTATAATKHGCVKARSHLRTDGRIRADGKWISKPPGSKMHFPPAWTRPQIWKCKRAIMVVTLLPSLARRCVCTNLVHINYITLSRLFNIARPSHHLYMDVLKQSKSEIPLFLTNENNR